MRKARYLLVMALVYVAARVAAAAYVAHEIDSGPDMARWNRIANVRVLPEGAQEAALRSFLARAGAHHARAGRPEAILVAGDSQLYGYFLAAPRTAAAFLAEELPRASVYNASRIAGSYAWTQWALEAALDEGLEPRILVLNVNPATRGGSGQRPAGPILSSSPFLSLLRANETLGIAGDAIRSRTRRGAPPFDPYDLRAVPPGDGTYGVIALQEDYYPRRLPAYVADTFRSLLEYSRGKVELVVVFASPHHYAPYNEAPYRYGWDTSGIVRDSLAICRQFAHALCLDYSTAFGRELFHDVVHLNEEGNRRLAAMLAAAIRARLGGRPMDR